MSQMLSPHRRFNPLLNEWILVSPHRAKRPWLGQVEKVSEHKRDAYDTTCYLCPGNTRANNEKNPHYESTYVFTNDFEAILPESKTEESAEDLFQEQSIEGTCRVMCFSPRHDISLAEMSPSEIESVIAMWKEQLTDLGKTYKWPQVFENKGTMMGCSNLHPHGQIWAGNKLPMLVEKEDNSQKEYFQKNNSPLLLEYGKRELEKKERIVFENEHWMVVVPFWAVWPFETMILPKTHVLRLTEVSPEMEKSLAGALKEILVKYDNLFETSFPYSMGLHGAPMDNGDNSHWQFHIHFYPPLLRSATVKKFMVGYELMAEPQRDMTAEQAAERLRFVSNIHYHEQQS